MASSFCLARPEWTVSMDPELQAVSRNKLDCRDSVVPSLLLLFWVSFCSPSEWRDHVQAGVSPDPRRGHTATLVVNRRGIKPERSQALKRVARPQARAGDAGNSQGSVLTRANNTANSPHRSRKMVVEDAAVSSPSHGKTVKQHSRRPSPTRRGFGGGHDGVRSKGRGRSKDRKCKEAKEQVSREMLIIGGAGMEPTKVSASWVI